MIALPNILGAGLVVCFVLLAGYFVTRSLVVGILNISVRTFNAALAGGVGCGVMVFGPIVAAGVTKALGLW